ncbi:MAG: GLPGLI family protein [Chitinophagaceae bacterium]|nr:GLPGLI family protein [Chitinophagaceae bacterium]
MLFRQLILAALPLVFATGVHAQQSNIITQGRIEFEKKTNLHSIFDSYDEVWGAEMKKQFPQFKLTYFDLYFTESKTLYKPGRENTDNNRLWELPAENNIIYMDLARHAAVSQKTVFEKTFLVQDSTRAIRWKLTDEKRTIAGFECRRANAVIMDSIYIVAFYTDEIGVTGGPESFSGLPGMILGLAIPHEHVTWFATKLFAVPVTEQELKIPAKGSKATNAGMYSSLKSSLKDWGKWGDRYIKAAML